jgi:hypothetical protein
VAVPQPNSELLLTATRWSIFSEIIACHLQTHKKRLVPHLFYTGVAEAPCHTHFRRWRNGQETLARWVQKAICMFPANAQMKTCKFLRWHGAAICNSLGTSW